MNTGVTLAALVQRRMTDLGIGSMRALHVRCNISKGCATRILNGEGRPRDATLRRLADGLALPLPIVRRAADRSDAQLGPFGWPPEFDRLGQAERDLLTDIGRRFLRHERTPRTDDCGMTDSGRPGRNTTRTVTQSPPLFLAARRRDPHSPTPP